MCDNRNDNNENNVLNVLTNKEYKESDETHFRDFIEKVIEWMFNLNNNSINYSFPRLYDSKCEPLVLQPSLFPLVSPTLYFALENESSI